MPIKFKEYGSGSPLVLLHGFPFDCSIWEDVIRYLGEKIRVITPDLRGHGESKVDDSHYFISDLAQDIIVMMNDLGILKTPIAGHSMGGYIALELARSNISRLSGLALIASHIYPDLEEKKRSRKKVIEKIKQYSVSDALANMSQNLSNDPLVKRRCDLYIEKMSSIGAIGALKAMAERPSSEDIWLSADLPTAIIAGVEDKLIPISLSRKIAALRENNLLVEIQDAGHMPMFKNPQLVAQALLKFMRIDRKG